MQGKLRTIRTGSQCSRILAYLQDGNSLTVEQCRCKGWGANLRSRVSNLKDAGYNVASKMVKFSGGFIAEYSLIKE